MRTTQADVVDRGLAAARVARRLFAGSNAMGAYVTTQLVVEHALLGRCRPHVAVVRGDPPVDGVLRGVPLLVVQLAPREDTAGWLRAGAAALWVLHDDHAELHLPGAGAKRLGPRDTLTVPGCPMLRLPVVGTRQRGSFR